MEPVWAALIGSGAVTGQGEAVAFTGCLAPFGCSRASLWVQPGDLAPTLQPARTKGIVSLKPGPLLRLEHSDSCQGAIQTQKLDPVLSFGFALRRRPPQQLFSGKAEFSVILRLTRFEFIPPRSTGGYVNLQAHLGRKMPPHLFKLQFCSQACRIHGTQRKNSRRAQFCTWE